ncbi:bacterio-opsin activator domain-containing protein [Natrinema salaciae]|uniref:PAS domain S-box-containing protein n=1 Tax=Natrinema salaciae TaxID=1186196 RepID=A0A1H9M3C1_9EURY|nr:bacterio-opsin activator domain-containing protein [Natrinema salaciae]SER17955.1 PAS domain S-box-containing protein [Natrinema salaciae]
MEQHWPGFATGPGAATDGGTDCARPISTAGDGAYELDSECRFVAVDDDFVALTGTERDALLGAELSAVVDGETTGCVEPMVRTLLAADSEPPDAEPANGEPTATDAESGTATAPPAGTTIEIDLPLLSADGETVSSTHRLRRLDDPNRPNRIAGIVRSRTPSSTAVAPVPDGESDGEPPPDRDGVESRRDRKRARERGQSSGELPPLRELLGHRSGGFYTLDADLTYTFVNERAAELLGFDSDRSRSDRDGGDGSSAVQGTDPTPSPPASPFDAAHERALARQRPLTVEEYHEPTSSWLEARLTPTESGLAVRVHDITGRKAYEERLEAENGLLRAIFEDAHDAILVGDEESITAANSAAGELLGLDRSALYGRSLREFLRDDRDSSSAWEAFVETGQLRDSFSVVRPDGTERVVEYDAVANVRPGTHLSILRDVTERDRRERELERQRERLAALEGVTGVVREITDAVVEGSTRHELERTACESLVDVPGCEFAFVAEVDTSTGSIRNRVEAGVDGYVDTIPLSTDPDDPAGRGPLGRAIRTQSMQVSTDVFDDPDFEPWRDDARERGYRSAAAIPIVHEGTLYGVIGLTSGHTAAFDGDKREIIAQIGDILGHAIASHDRKRALVSDDLIELEYEIRNAFELFGVTDGTDERISFDRVIRVDDDQYLEYGTTSAAAFPAFERFVERVSHWDEVTVLDDVDGEVSFELRITSPPMFSVVADHGGYVDQAVLEDGDYAMVVHLPKRTDVRAVTAAIQEVYPAAENVARRQVTPITESIDRIQDHLSDVLTDRQRTVLETAYYAGFFEWPRTSTGEDIAERLNISPATFHEHFRTAQRKLVAAVIDRPRSTLRDVPDD